MPTTNGVTPLCISGTDNSHRDRIGRRDNAHRVLSGPAVFDDGFFQRDRAAADGQSGHGQGAVSMDSDLG